MANCITRHIPNTLTCLNLFSGCIACVMAFEARYEWALAFIIFSAVFDFFDGMMARALDAHSIIGKDLDSLADDVSFGVAPSLIVFSLFKEMALFGRNGKLGRCFPLSRISFVRILCTAACQVQQRYPPDELFRRTSRPGKRLVLGFIGDGAHDWLVSGSFHPVYLLLLVCLFSWLLVSEIPMFSLKFKNLSWKDNKTSFIFLLVCIPFLIFLGICSFAAIIVWYILLSLITRKSK